MIEGIVISLKILDIGMGNRGSKSVINNLLPNAKSSSILLIIVKEQRVDGSYFGLLRTCA